MKLIRTCNAWPNRLSTFVLLALHVGALALFCTGFLLTRIELPDRSAAFNAASTPESSNTPVRKTVWMIIDALRLDFVSNTSNYGMEQSIPVMSVLQNTCAVAVSLA